MDLNDYWQENKRFVTTVGVGALIFLIAYLVLDGNYQGEIRRANVKRTNLVSELGEARYTRADLSAAREENDKLLEAVGVLAGEAAFEPRPDFRYDGSQGSASNHYLRVLNRVREDLIPRANRANLVIDPALGMPALSPTREDEVVRTLDALDVVETVGNLAIQAGVRRMERIQLKLDPGLRTRSGVGRVERTRVKFTFEGPARPLTRLLALTQRPPDGRSLLIDELEMQASRNKPGEARLDLTLVATRLTEPTGTTAQP